jgi:hypothetical protein
MDIFRILTRFNIKFKLRDEIEKEEEEDGYTKLRVFKILALSHTLIFIYLFLRVKEILKACLPCFIPRLSIFLSIFLVKNCSFT